jgi:hypothetical protein
MSSAPSTSAPAPSPAAPVLSAATAVAPGAARKRSVYALWYAESCLAFAAVWTLLGDHAPRTLLAVAAFLLLCGVALAVPGHALRAWMLRAGVGAGRRVKALEAFLVLAAGGAAAALSTAHGWAAIICILLVGDALWALEMESRAAKRGPGVTK